MTTFILNWQDPATRRWLSVGKLIKRDNIFIFFYTKGAEYSGNFVPFGNMSKLENVYVSETLFPIFANRVLNEKRPEFSRYASWSGLKPDSERDPLLLMARMGGGRATDTLQVYPVPERTESGLYSTLFFCHGLSHMTADAQHRVQDLETHETLFPMLDVTNPFDPNAIALRTADPAALIGYCPRYLARDIRQLLLQPRPDLRVEVKQVNYDAPLQYRLLCQVEAGWPKGFNPCDYDDQQPLVPIDLEAVVNAVRRGHTARAKLA